MFPPSHLLPLVRWIRHADAGRSVHHCALFFLARAKFPTRSFIDALVFTPEALRFPSSARPCVCSSYSFDHTRGPVPGIKKSFQVCSAIKRKGEEGGERGGVMVDSAALPRPACDCRPGVSGVLEYDQDDCVGTGDFGKSWSSSECRVAGGVYRWVHVLDVWKWRVARVRIGWEKGIKGRLDRGD